MVKSELCLDKTKILSAVAIMTPCLDGRTKKQTFPQEGTHCKIQIRVIESEKAWDRKRGNTCGVIYFSLLAVSVSVWSVLMNFNCNYTCMQICT